jgi:hypothetical protein
MEVVTAGTGQQRNRFLYVEAQHQNEVDEVVTPLLLP